MGSCFSVRLPAALKVVAPSEIKHEGELPPARYRAKVVVVDDNTDAAETLAGVLKTRGHEVRVAFDGAEAVQEITRTRPQAALVDIGLPKMNGYEVAKAVRNNGANDTVLIAVTGWSGAATAQVNCGTIPPGPARTDCYIGLGRIARQNSEIAAGVAQQQTDRAIYRSVTGRPPKKKVDRTLR